MAEHTQQALPGKAFFLAQTATEVGDHEQIVWPTVLAKTRAPDFPAPAAAGKRALADFLVGQRQPVAEIERLRRLSIQLRESCAQQALGGRIGQLEKSLRIEREHGDIESRDDLGQQGALLLDGEPLFAQRLRQCVDFDDDFADGVVATRIRAAQAVVAFTQGFEQVRHRTQWIDRATTQVGGQDQRRQHDGAEGQELAGGTAIRTQKHDAENRNRRNGDDEGADQQARFVVEAPRFASD